MRSKSTAILASNWFFGGVVVLLAVQAAWIALTAQYPAAFDEQQHLGMIQLYAHQWSPFFATQPSGVDYLGALSVGTSFLYHYLMSVPYRLISALTHDQTVQIVCLRFINIALFAGALYLFRRLLMLATSSKALVHLTLLFFVLVPVVPLLAAQINYDNLFIPLVALGLLWAARALSQWRTQHALPLELLVRLLLLGMLASVVKYAYLPLLAASGLLAVYIGWQLRRQLPEAAAAGWRAIAGYKRVLYLAAAAAAIVLWLGSYGRNLLVYHALLPSCPAVLGLDRCQALAPWARDYAFAHDGRPKPPPVLSLPVYDWRWVTQSVTELVFSVTSNFEANGVTVDYHTVKPLPVVAAITWTVFVGGALLIGYYRRRLWQLPVIRIGVLAGGLYTVSLWWSDYLAYLHTGYPVAVHGRYLLPFLPLVLAAIGLCITWLMQHPKLAANRMLSRQRWLVVLVLAFTLQGGGFVTYIIRSDPTWFWDRDTATAHITAAAKRVLSPVVLGG